MIRLLVGFIFLFACSAYGADAVRRTVNLEFEPIAGAKQYDIELKDLASGAVIEKRLSGPAWTGKLPLGAIEMRVRSIDQRGVPGDWSKPEKFEVGLEKAKLIQPAEKSSVLAGSDQEVDFKWNAVSGADSYEIEITGEGYKKTSRVKTPEYKIELEPARHFTWKIVAHGPHRLLSEASGEFDSVGGKLNKPEIEKPTNGFVRELRWSKPEHVQSVDLTISRFKKDTKTWETVSAEKGMTIERLPFPASWPGGIYRMQLRSQGTGWQTSDLAGIRFPVRDGDRSEEAEESANIRASIDRHHGWYGIASYLITTVNYSSTNYDKSNPNATEFGAVGGTGRLGAGYMKNQNTWGFVGFADLSGFTTKGDKNLTYASVEASVVRKSRLGQRGNLQVFGGLFYREDPVVIGDSTTLQVGGYSKAAVVGPHLGVEYDYAMTSKLGLEFKFHLYDGILKVDTPNGQPIDSSLATEIGLLGSRRFGKSFTGFVGFVRRDNNLRYKADPSGSFAGSTNSVKIQGNYVNLIAEYNF